MARLLTAIFLWLTLVGVAVEGGSGSALAPLLHLSPKADGHGVRRVLFGGEPHLSFCKQKSNPGLNDFVTDVRKHLGKASAKVKTVIISCGEKMSASGKVFAKSLKLKTRQEGEPVVLWSVNGDAPMQLPTSAYTSALPDKGQSADAKSGKVSVKLDAKELAEYAQKRKNPKLTAISTQGSLEKSCLSMKYQVCVVVLHKGVLPSETRKKFLKIANAYRYLRFVTVDKSKHELTGIPKLDAKQDLSVVVIRRGDYIYSGPPSEKSASQSDDSREDKIAKRKMLKKALSVPSMGPRVRVSACLKELIDPEVVYKHEKRLAAFRKGEIEDYVGFIDTPPEELVYLVRQGGKGYLLGSDEIVHHFVGKEAFDQQVDEKALETHQQDFLMAKIRAMSKKNRGARDLKGLPYPGNAKDHKKVASFLKQAAEQVDTSIKLLAVQPKLQTKRKPATKKPKKKKPTMPKPKTKATSTAKARGKPTEEQLERERQRRAEMEQETLESGAVAFEAEPVEDDADNCEDAEVLEEETAEVIDLGGEESADADNEEELDLDDF